MKKRVLRTNSISKLILGGILITAYPSHAQFNKFKSKSRFGDRKAVQKNQKNNFADDAGNREAFGARTEAMAPATNSKFVNLNPETAFGPEVVTNFDFPDSDIMELTNHMQKLTGINLILDKDVKGKVSITAPSTITVGDAWKAYLAALNMAGFTLVKSGAFYKIINARDVRYVPTKIYTGSYTPETESHIMKILALKNVDAAEISRNFRPFMSRYGRIIDIKQTNTIIISDTGANIVRLEKLIKFLDVPGHEETLQIIPVKNSSAAEIAKLLDEILRSGGTSRSSSSRARTSSSKRFSSSKSKGSNNISKIIAEPRTNSIIAMANAEGAQELRNLIKKLDVDFSSSNSDKIHVHYLNYGSAEELAKTLSTLVSGAKATSSRSRTSSRSFITRGTDGSTLFNGEVKITADKTNNALVVTASATDWLTIKNVIGKLDIPRDQVYVEGLIMETNVTKIRAFGTEFVGAYGAGNVQRGGFTNNNGIFNLLSGDPTGLNGFFAGIGGGGARTVEIGGQSLTINSVNGLIKAIASNAQTNVLATPQILAMDNTDAEFEVGATVPVVNQTTTNGTVSNNVTNQEAKLSLKITPQINKVTRFVKLKINQSINDFVGETNTAGTGQATTTRSAVTEVMVRDKDTIAMGGLLRDKEVINHSKVPLLGDIPVLGWLFKSRQRQVNKVNLLFFLTPRIISPYENEAAKNSLRALNERTKNMANIIDDENPDPYAKKSEMIAQKIMHQKQGALYGDEPNTYQKSNENTQGIGNAGQEPEVPNYQEIIEDAKK